MALAEHGRGEPCRPADAVTQSLGDAKANERASSASRLPIGLLPAAALLSPHSTRTDPSNTNRERSSFESKHLTRPTKKSVPSSHHPPFANCPPSSPCLLVHIFFPSVVLSPALAPIAKVARERENAARARPFSFLPLSSSAAFSVFSPLFFWRLFPGAALSEDERKEKAQLSERLEEGG